MNLKKILAGVVAAALAVTSLTVFASADDDTTSATVLVDKTFAPEYNEKNDSYLAQVQLTDYCFSDYSEDAIIEFTVTPSDDATFTKMGIMGFSSSWGGWSGTWGDEGVYTISTTVGELAEANDLETAELYGALFQVVAKDDSGSYAFYITVTDIASEDDTSTSDDTTTTDATDTAYNGGTITVETTEAATFIKMGIMGFSSSWDGWSGTWGDEGVYTISTTVGKLAEANGLETAKLYGALFQAVAEDESGSYAFYVTVGGDVIIDETIKPDGSKNDDGYYTIGKQLTDCFSDYNEDAVIEFTVTPSEETVTASFEISDADYENIFGDDVTDVTVDVEVNDEAKNETLETALAAIAALAGEEENENAITRKVSIVLYDQDGDEIEPAEGFGIEVVLPYDGVSNLVAFVGDDGIEYIGLTVDEEENTMSFIAAHFSDYYLLSLSDESLAAIADEITSIELTEYTASSSDDEEENNSSNNSSTTTTSSGTTTTTDDGDDEDSDSSGDGTSDSASDTDSGDDGGSADTTDGTGDTDAGSDADKNQATGVALAVIPAAVAAAAVVISKKRK